MEKQYGEVIDGVLEEVTNEGLDFAKTNPKEFWKDVKILGNFSLCGCLLHNSLTIPESVEKIDKWAFVGFKSLEKFKIPKQIKHLWGFMFYDCENLKTIYIPERITKIEKDAFYGCSKDLCVKLNSAYQYKRIIAKNPNAFDGVNFEINMNEKRELSLIQKMIIKMNQLLRKQSNNLDKTNNVANESITSEQNTKL